MESSITNAYSNIGNFTTNTINPNNEFNITPLTTTTATIGTLTGSGWIKSIVAQDAEPKDAEPNRYFYSDKCCTFAIKPPEYTEYKTEHKTEHKGVDKNIMNTLPKDFSPLALRTEPFIANINVLVPNRVVEITIYDGTPHIYKQVCKEPDVFDLKYALALAWAKYNNKHYNLDYSIEGIEYIAQAYIHRFNKSNKEFDRAIKAYNNWLKEEDKKKAEEEERKAIIARRKAKNKKRREKRKEQQNQEQIDIIAKAIQKSKEN